MKAAREALELTQKAFCEEYGHNLRTLQKNEAGSNEAGVCLAGAFIRAGINANWLLTGAGPMLLADLAPKPAPPLRINVDALAATLDAMRKTAKPGETPEATSRKAARFYAMLVEEEMITEDGVGNGILKAAG